MNIFSSTAAMTGIDLAILVCGAVALVALLRLRSSLRTIRWTGLTWVVLGMALPASMFLFDLVTMWVLPGVIGEVGAHAVMVDLHLNWSWVVSLASAIALAVGIVITARDVRRSEQLLETKDELYQRIVEDQAELIVRWRPDGVRTFVNDAYCRYRRKPRERLVGESFFHLLTESGRAAVGPKLAAMTPDQPTAIDCHQSVTPDGSLRWQEWTDLGIFDDSGQLVEVQSVGRDITEREKIEAELRSREQQYQAIFQSSVSGLTISGLEDGRLLEVNNSMAEMLGYTREELRGLPLERYCPRKTIAVYGRMLRAVRQGERFPFAVEVLHRDGRRLELEGHFLPFVFEGEKRVLGQVRDVTERNRITREVRKNELALRALFEHAPDAIVVQGSDGTILSVNRAACALYRGEREELEGRDFMSLVPKDEVAITRANLARVARGELSRLEGACLTLDETPIAISMRMSRFEHGGEPALLCHLTDITARRRLESQLRQSQKMEAVGRLAGGIAHDFNNLLTAILGYSELVQEELEADHQVRGDVAEIERAAERAADLTRQLLAFSRQQVLQPRVLDLNEVVRGIRNLCERTIGDDVHLELDLDPDLGSIKIDKSQVEQVLLNLAINARDAMPRGGKLSLGTRRMVLEDGDSSEGVRVEPGHYAALLVTDTGSGMSEETRAHVFEPFFTTKAPEKGTGLGLSTVYGIVKQSGGYIWVESELGRGSCFKILLPQVADTTPDQADVVPVAVASRPAGVQTVLLVDDNVTVLALAQRTLEEQGYRVLSATSAEEAESVAQESESRVDLLLTDLALPASDGLELARSLSGQIRDLRVVLMTGYSRRSRFGGKTELEGRHFLQKPFVRRELIATVTAALAAEPNGEALQ